MLGYTKNLYILPFDHRSSFVKAFVNNLKELDKGQKKLISNYKKIVFDGFLTALKKIKNPQDCAVMVDETFGLEIIKLAKKKKITLLLPVEKSGSKIFAFEYDKEFNKYILQIKPNFVKALVRYNVANKKNNLIQLKRLKTLNEWCQKNEYKFLLELLVPPTPADLKKTKNKQEIYDSKIRPGLTLKAIQEFHQAGIEPDIWKIEAMENKADWDEIINLIRQGKNRQEVGIIMLGRGESFAKVKQWMDVCPKYLLNGFAVGRTVFLRPLLDFHQKQINKKQAVNEITNNYLELIKYWER